MQRILVIGCPGAGKSTFARAEFDAKLEIILQRENWIIDGNYAKTLELRLARCDTVYFNAARKPAMTKILGACNKKNYRVQIPH